MKKMMLIVVVLFIIPIGVCAESKQVILDSCVQADQIKFKDTEGFVTTYQLHSVVSPSTNHITKGEEPYSKEALDYSCNRLKNSTTITIEEVETSAVDHGEAYVFIDGLMLQEELLKLGYAKLTVLEEDNPYYEQLANAEVLAKEQELGIWKEEEKTLEEAVEEIKPKEEVKKEEEENSIMSFINDILDSIVAGINKMIDSILQKIDNML